MLAHTWGSSSVHEFESRLFLSAQVCTRVSTVALFTDLLPSFRHKHARSRGMHNVCYMLVSPQNVHAFLYRYWHHLYTRSVAYTY